VTCYTQPCKPWKVTYILDYLPQGGESSPRGRWGICAPALPEVLTINMVKGLNFIKSFHDAVSKIHQSHRTFISHKSRPSRGIYHIGESDPGRNAVVEDDRPSLNFDEQGYIYII
jgi:hypothetical protein